MEIVKFVGNFLRNIDRGIANWTIRREIDNFRNDEDHSERRDWTNLKVIRWAVLHAPTWRLYTGAYDQGVPMDRAYPRSTLLNVYFDRYPEREFKFRESSASKDLSGLSILGIDPKVESRINDWEQGIGELKPGDRILLEDIQNRFKREPH